MISTQTWFHSSESDDISEFWPLTHFGTKESALARAALRLFADHMPSPGSLMEVRLAIKPSRVFHIVKDWWSPKPHAFALHMSRYGPEGLRTAFKDFWQMLMDSDDIIESPYLRERKLMAEMLVRHGVDAVTYENGIEGNGSPLSVCVTNPETIIKTAAPRALTEQELAWAIDPAKEALPESCGTEESPRERIARLRKATALS